MVNRFIWQRLQRLLHQKHWFALVISLLLIAPLGWLIVYELIAVLSEGHFVNEDQGVIIYLLGLPFFTALSFVVLIAVYQAVSGSIIVKPTKMRGILLAPIILFGLERGTAYGIVAPRHLDRSTGEWGVVIACIWSISMVVSGALLRREQHSIHETVHPN